MMRRSSEERNINLTEIKFKKSLPDWVPIDTRNSIAAFWEYSSRTENDYIAASEEEASSFSFHVNGSGFRHPKNGQRVIYLTEDKEFNRGRYIHAWNNMGRLIQDNGRVIVVSTCDMWVPFFESKEDLPTDCLMCNLRKI